MVEVCYDNAVASGAGDFVSTNITANVQGIWNRSATGTGCSLAASFTNVSGVNIRPDITLTANLAATSIATIVGNNRTENLANNGTYYFYTATGSVLNSITGASASLGCVSSTILKQELHGNHSTAVSVLKKYLTLHLLLILVPLIR